MLESGVRARPAASDASALHQHRGTRAVQHLVEHAPSSGGLALWVAHRDLPAAPADPAQASAPWLVTDGREIAYAPAFAELPLPLQAGLVAHAVLHVALRHAQRCVALRQRLGDVDVALFNVCADAICNSALGHLGWLSLPPQAVTLPTLLSRALRLDLDATLALAQWDVERLYQAVDDRRPSGRNRSGRADGGSGAAAGTGSGTAARADEAAAQSRPLEDGPTAAQVRALLDPTLRDLVPDGLGAGASAHSADEAPEAVAEQTRLWRERLERAHAGDGVHSILRVLLADLPQLHTPWEQILRTHLMHALAPGRSLSWSRPARSWMANQGRIRGRDAAGVPVRHRMPFEPGTGPSRRVPRLVVVVDVSGSIARELLERFARELDAITRRLEAPLTLVIGDDQVRAVVPCAAGQSRLVDISFQGGGGTDFTPLLQEAERHRPDCVVVLTDLDGPARHAPACPVLWAVPLTTGSGLAPIAPFGRVLLLR